MGFSISYTSTEQISPAVQTEMIAALSGLSQNRTWLSCEPPRLANHAGLLGGSSKPNFSPHPEDVASAKASGQSDGTVNDLLEILCELSRRFGVDWEISHDYSEGPLGYIRQGDCDDDVRTQCEAFGDVAVDILDVMGELDNDDATST